MDPTPLGVFGGIWGCLRVQTRVLELKIAVFDPEAPGLPQMPDMPKMAKNGKNELYLRPEAKWIGHMSEWNVYKLIWDVSGASIGC